MDVAGRLFAENGYDGVGMRQIAKESGVNVSSIFYHFKSKALLFEEILDYKYKAHYEKILQAIEPLTDPRQKLESIIGTSFDVFLEDETFLRLVQRDIVDMITHKHRSAFMETYSKYFALSGTLLQATLDRPIERRVTLSLLSVILGYTEVVAALMGSNWNIQEKDEWCAEQRSELIAVGKSICRM